MAGVFCAPDEWLRGECKCTGERCECEGIEVLVTSPDRAEGALKGSVVVLVRADA